MYEDEVCMYEFITAISNLCNVNTSTKKKGFSKGILRTSVKFLRGKMDPSADM